MAHQYAIVPAAGALQGSLGAGAGRQQHEQALQGQGLPGRDDVAAAAAQRAQQAQLLQHQRRHALLHNRRQRCLQRILLCFGACSTPSMCGVPMTLLVHIHARKTQLTCSAIAWLLSGSTCLMGVCMLDAWLGSGQLLCGKQGVTEAGV